MSVAVAETRRAGRALPALLRESRTFRRYWGAHTISLFGDQVTLLALPLVAVLALDASAAQMGYLTALALAPNLLFALHAGAWVDRVGRRRQVMIATDVGRALLLLSVPLAYALDGLTLAQLLVVAFALGTLSVLFGVSDASLFVSIVPRDRFVEGSSLLNGSRAFSFVAGTSAAGLLVRALSAPIALVADALTFLGSAVLLGRIAPQEAPPDREGGGVRTGVRYVTGSPVVRPILLATATINFFNFVFWALFVLYATRSLGIGAGTLGLVLGAGAVGGLAGSVVAAPLSRAIGLGPCLAVGCVLFPAPLLLVPLASGSERAVLFLLFLAELGSGFGVMLLDISAGIVFAAVIPHELRSRVSGAYTFANYGVRVLGSLAGGWLGASLGLRPTLWIATAGALAGVLWLLPSPVLRIRTLPEPEPEPEPAA
jgi:MFS family permease